MAEPEHAVLEKFLEEVMPAFRVAAKGRGIHYLIHAQIGGTQFAMTDSNIDTKCLPQFVLDCAARVCDALSEPAGGGER